MTITFFSTKSYDERYFMDTSESMGSGSHELVFPNVLITGHQAFLTHTALSEIARVTLCNLSELDEGKDCANEVRAEA